MPYSQALRISRHRSSQNGFSPGISNLKDWILAKDYPQKVVNEQINKVVFGKQPTRECTSEESVPFVATYHPQLKDFDILIKN